MRSFALLIALAASAAADNSVAVSNRTVEIVPPLDHAPLGHDSVCCSSCGWSTDGADLGYCASGVFPPAPTWCEALVGKKHVEASSEDKKQRALFKQLRARGFAQANLGAWPHDDLILIWRATDPTALEIGAKLRGENDGAYPLQLSDAEGFRSHPDVIALSADQKTLGVIGHWYQGEWSNGYRVGTIETRILAEQAYNLAGLKQLRRGNWSQAAALFAKAANADPTSEKAAYNHACALARMEAPEAKDALARAIGLGGAATRKKALHDADFAGVRGQPWFIALVR